MAKIRVYELARDLNMKNPALLEKLKEMDVEVRSHMSSIDDDVAEKVKQTLLAGNAEAVEVTRVKPTVIRRRKKRLEEPPEEAVDAAAEETAESLSEGEEAAAETAATPVGKETAADATAEAEPTPEPPADAETAATPPSVEKDARETAEAAPPAEAEDESAPSEAAETEATEPEAPEEADGDARAASEEPKADAAEKPAPKKAKQSKKARRGKKETPAKIIQLPVKPPREKKETPGPEEREAAEAGSPPVGTPEPPRKHAAPGDAAAEDKKKKKGKKGEEGDEHDRKFFKKKISFKRKEVIEGDALYSGLQRPGRKGRKGQKVKATPAQKPQITVPKAIKRRVKIDDTIILSDLAKRMGIKANEMIAKLMSLGVMATVNQTIDYDTAVLVASEFNYEVERASFEEEEILKVEADDPEKLASRPPVVTIMGHVDHGKTSLLDIIRKTRVTEGEAGGITQHIGAYYVTTDKGQVVFLDTPGHEAFTAMRARGAKVTDIVVLVVAADDGVMPQTVEAINHSKAAGVPIIVAVNKIDKANADVDRVYRELSEQGLVPEDWGGDTIFVKVSAKQNTGIDDLLEMILLQSEVLELKANPDKHALGYVVEAKLDAGRGPVATILVQEGTLHTGDSVVCGVHYGKVRAMLDDLGQPIDFAGPSIPVEVIGLGGVPNAGDELVSLADEKNAKQVSQHRSQKQRSLELAKTSRVSLEKLFDKMQEGEVKELKLIIKADVQGSIEALAESLTRLSNEEVSIQVIHSATGAITESDISLAAVSDAIIIGFNIRPAAKIQSMAAEENVDMRFYSVIYDVIKEVRDAILGMMASTFEERVLGRAEIREVFHVPKIGAIAGSYVPDGKIRRGGLARLVRDGVVVYEGKISSLRRFKDDVKEVQSGYECGIGLEHYNDLKSGDIIECYTLEEIKPELQ